MNNICEHIKKLSSISTPIINDAMAKLLSTKFKHQTMDCGIKPIHTSFRVCGPAFTVRCYPGATYAMEMAIELAPAESVIVCDGQGSEAGVLMGEIMSTVAQKRGIAGAVIDGAVRDVDDVIKMGFPLFARHITPRNGTFDQIGDLQQIISCGGVSVQPDDIICGDVNGVVVVPSKIVSHVVQSATELSLWESSLKNLLVKGISLSEAVKMIEKPQIQNL